PFPLIAHQARSRATVVRLEGSESEAVGHEILQRDNIAAVRWVGPSRWGILTDWFIRHRFTFNGIAFQQCTVVALPFEVGAILWPRLQLAADSGQAESAADAFSVQQRKNPRKMTDANP